MSINSLRAFIAVAQTGSFVKAASLMDLPPSSVSRHISALEKSLGQKLLYRHTRAVRLTEVGVNYFEEIREALLAIDLATEHAKGTATAPHGTLKINAPVSFGRKHLSGLINQFQQQYLQIDVELILTDSYIDPVQEGADIVIRIGDFADSSLNYRKISDEQFLACAAPTYLQKSPALNSPDDLLKHNCLVYKGNLGKRAWYFRQSDDQPFRAIEVAGNLCSNNADILVNAALLGQGIILFPKWLIAEHLASGELLPVLKEWQCAEKASQQTIYALYPANRLKSPKVSCFLEFMSEYFGSPTPYWGLT
jgi:DNA-binding transcriptional LysR family regulator